MFPQLEVPRCPSCNNEFNTSDHRPLVTLAYHIPLCEQCKHTLNGDSSCAAPTHSHYLLQSIVGYIEQKTKNIQEFVYRRQLSEQNIANLAADKATLDQRKEDLIVKVQELRKKKEVLDEMETRKRKWVNCSTCGKLRKGYWCDTCKEKEMNELFCFICVRQFHAHPPSPPPSEISVIVLDDSVITID